MKFEILVNVIEERSLNRSFLILFGYLLYFIYLCILRLCIVASLNFSQIHKNSQAIVIIL